jgi:hypothetical protein
VFHLFHYPPVSPVTMCVRDQRTAFAQLHECIALHCGPTRLGRSSPCLCDHTTVLTTNHTGPITALTPSPKQQRRPHSLNPQVMSFLAKNYSQLLLDFVERTASAEGVGIISDQLLQVRLQSASQCAAAAAPDLAATGNVDFGDDKTLGGKVVLYLNATLDVRANAD